MRRFFISYIFIALLVVSLLPHAASAAKATTVSGTFLKANFVDVSLDEKTTTTKLASITIQTKGGTVRTFNIASSIALFVDNRNTKIGAFKYGMYVTATISSNKVNKLQGNSEIDYAFENISSENKTVFGEVMKIDAPTKTLTVKLYNGNVQRLFYKRTVRVEKNNSPTKMSTVRIGDRVKLTISSSDEDLIDKITIATDGTLISNVYKGTMKNIDTFNNNLYVQNIYSINNWNWQSSTHANPIPYNSNTKFYVNDSEIQSYELKKYINNEVYYVTAKQNGLEYIAKLIIKTENERTYFDTLTYNSPYTKAFTLNDLGTTNYGNSTIIVRNNRLIDASSLSVPSSGFVLTEGFGEDTRINIVVVADDELQAPGNSNATLHFGKISSINGYKLSLETSKQFINNKWVDQNSNTFEFNNDTPIIYDYSLNTVYTSKTLEFTAAKTKYAYFYVSQDNEIVQSFIINATINPASKIRTANYFSDYYYDDITLAYDFNFSTVTNVSEWDNTNTKWKMIPTKSPISLSNSLILEEGKVISSSDINVNDKLWILYEDVNNARIVIVN